MAAFICEPIPCCAGQIVLPDGYLKMAYEYVMLYITYKVGVIVLLLFRHVRSAGGLCIADEIQCGYGRVGSHFWAYELQGKKKKKE